jgi:hypothetical protein
LSFFDDDRIKETTTTAGLADVALDGHVRTFFDFSSVYGEGDEFDYVMHHASLDEVEIGKGVFHAPATVERNTIYRSSNADAKVDFSAGTKYIFVAVRKGKFDGTVPCSGGAVAAPGAVTGSNLSGTNTGDQVNVPGSSGSCTGNAATATALQTARNINGVPFDGTANITVTAAAGTLTGTTLNAAVVNSSLTSLGTLTALTVAGNATIGVDGEDVQIGDPDFSTDDVGIQGQVVAVTTPAFSVNANTVYIGNGGADAVITLQGVPTVYGNLFKVWGASPTVQLIDTTASNTGGLFRVDGGIVTIARCNDDGSGVVNLVLIDRTSGVLTIGNVYVVQQLGVGTSGPDRAFTVAHLTGYGQVASFYSNAGDESVGIGCEASGISWIGTTTNHNFAILTNGGNRFQVDTSGRIGIGTAPGGSALMNLESTTGAFLPPRMTTTQRDALTAVDGMVIYNSTTGAMNYRKAGAWVAI